MAGTSAIHLNGNILCAIDVETTGLRAGYHDIFQICILPLDSNFKPSKTVLPFYTEMLPRRPENTDPKAISLNKTEYAQLLINGLDSDRVADLLIEWFDKLPLPIKKNIIPLAHNWVFDRGFILDWLGHETFEHIFAPMYRDTMVAASYDNDRADFHVTQIPFPKVNLKYLCSQLKVENQRHHDALADCVATAEVYRRMVLRGTFA